MIFNVGAFLGFRKRSGVLSMRALSHWSEVIGKRITGLRCMTDSDDELQEVPPSTEFLNAMVLTFSDGTEAWIVVSAGYDKYDDIHGEMFLDSAGNRERAIVIQSANGAAGLGSPPSRNPKAIPRRAPTQKMGNYNT